MLPKIEELKKEIEFLKSEVKRLSEENKILNERISNLYVLRDLDKGVPSRFRVNNAPYNRKE